jgi:hypothetical protein
MTIQYMKKVATAVGVSIVLAVGAAQAADNVPSDNQVKQYDNTVQAANTSSAAGTSKQAVPNAAKVQVRERVDINSPSYRKFLEDIAARSGG